MEKENTKFKQSKRKTEICSNGGGNLGGLLLFGGALAIGSFVAFLAARKRKHSDNKHKSCKNKEDQASGNQCCASNGSTETVAAQVVSTESLMSEENLFSAVDKKSENNDKEILLTHDLRQDSIEMRDGHCLAQGFQLLDLDIISLDQLDDTVIAEEDAIDAVKISTEEITSAEEDYNGKEEKKQEEESLLVEENIEVAKKEEPTGVEKEYDSNNFEKEIIEVEQEEAIDIVDEEDATDSVKISIEAISSGQSTNEENKQAREKLLLEEKIEEESVGPKACAEITSLIIVKDQSDNDDHDGDFKKRSPLTEISEVEQQIIDEVTEDYAMDSVDEDEESEKKHSIDVREYRGENEDNTISEKEITEVNREEAIDIVEEEDAIVAAKISIDAILSVQSTDDEEENNYKQAEEKLLEIIEVDGEKLVGVKACMETTSSSIAQGDGDSKKGSPLTKIIEVEKEIIGEVAEDNAMDAVRMCINENSTKPLLNAQIPQVLTTEQDENNKTEDINHFKSTQNYAINPNRENSDFAKKEENLEIAASNKKTTLHSRKWRISVQHMLIMASILLLHLAYFHVRSFLSSL